MLDIVLPDGRLAVQKTYREKAGQGALLKARLTPEVRAVLSKTKVAERTLLDYVNELIACAAELGGLEDERAGTAEDGVLPAERQAARNRWIRVVNTITQSLSLVPIEDSRIDAIRERIDEASSAADRRGGEGAIEEAPPVRQPANHVAPPALAAVASA